MPNMLGQMARLAALARDAFALSLLLAAVPARADELVVYGAGSLREAIGEIARTFNQAASVPVRTEFGPSGRMRERIEKGEHVDLFTSADIGHARKLVTDGRASVMAMFARNTLCVLAPQTARLDTENVTDRLLDGSTRIGISPPKADPLGDYTMVLFDRLESIRPGSRSGLASRSTVIDVVPGSPAPHSGDINVDAIQDRRVDVDVIYCSGKARYERAMQDATVTVLPANLQVGPEYGLAVMKNAGPQAAGLALAILSPEGQRILARWGFTPVALPKE